MSRAGDDIVFQRVTGCLRKPVTRFRLASGRQIELLGFHLEPGWASTGNAWRPIAEEVARRLYPNESPVIVGNPETVPGPSYLCVAYFYSDSPVEGDLPANYSLLPLCGFVENVDKGIRGIVCDLLSQADWEASASNDFMR
jgi:hypothetical protein